MYVGLDGNIFQRNFTQLDKLAEHCWFKTTWQLCYRYIVRLRIREKYDVPKVIECDISITEMLLSFGIFNTNQLIRLNIYCRYKIVHCFRDATLVDGSAINSTMITHREGTRTITFSKECPCPKDNSLWCAALNLLASSNLTVSDNLGDYINMPHNHGAWYQSEGRKELYEVKLDDYNDVYKLYDRERPSRSPVYEWSQNINKTLSPTRLINVDSFENFIVILLASAPIPVPMPTYLKNHSNNNYKHTLMTQYLDISGLMVMDDG